MQKFIWRAVYQDDTSLSEFTDGIEASFYDIDRESLVEFQLVGPFIISINMNTGEIFLDNQKLVMPQLIQYYNQPTIYELIQFKRGIAKLCASSMETVNQCIISYNVGWKYTLGDTHVQILLSVFESTNTVTVTLKKTDLATQESTYADYLLRGKQL